jgi:hypothetical protein
VKDLLASRPSPVVFRAIVAKCLVDANTVFARQRLDDGRWAAG